MHALAGRMDEQSKRDDEVIGEHLDMLIDLLLGYKVNESIVSCILSTHFRVGFMQTI